MKRVVVIYLPKPHEGAFARNCAIIEAAEFIYENTGLRLVLPRELSIPESEDPPPQPLHIEESDPRFNYYIIMTANNICSVAASMDIKGPSANNERFQLMADYDVWT